MKKRKPAKPPKPAKIRIVPVSAQRFMPQLPQGAELVGVVERSMQIGALARLDDGRYVQINGDVVQPLNTSQVETALRASAKQVARRPPPPAQAAPSGPKPAVTVTIKRRRVPVGVDQS